MLHFRMGGVLVVSNELATLDQVRRVATFCGSSDIRPIGTSEEALPALRSMKHAQLVAVDLRLGNGLARAVLEQIQSASEERIRWLATLALLPANAATTRERSQAQSLGFDAVIPGPFSDTLLEKRFRQVVLDSGADPRDDSQIEAIYELLEGGDFLRAEGVLRRGLRRFPEALPYVTLQCELHMRFKRHREALILAMTSLHSHPGYTPLRHIAARCYVAEGNVSQAFIVLEQTERDAAGEAFALRFDTFERVVKCLNNEGVRRAHRDSTGGAEDALGLYAHALESTVGFPDHHRYLLWHNMGMAYKRVGSLEKARSAFLMATNLSPREFTDAHKGLAEVEQEIRAWTVRAPLANTNRRQDPSLATLPAKPPKSLTPALDTSFSTESPSLAPSLAPRAEPPIVLQPLASQTKSATLSALRSLGSAVAALPAAPKSDLSSLLHGSQPAAKSELPEPPMAPEEDGAPQTLPGQEALDLLADDTAIARLDSVPPDLLELFKEDEPERQSSTGEDDSPLKSGHPDESAENATAPLSDELAAELSAETGALETMTALPAEPPPDRGQLLTPPLVSSAPPMSTTLETKTATPGKKSSQTQVPPPVLDEAARRQQRREARLKFIMFEKELQEG
jgi:tetratricopeptide (TPR) repeat protein